MVNLDSKEILTYLMLVVVGYFIAKMFSRRCEGFNISTRAETSRPDRYKADECDISIDCRPNGWGGYEGCKCGTYKCDSPLLGNKDKNLMNQTTFCGTGKGTTNSLGDRPDKFYCKNNGFNKNDTCVRNGCAKEGFYSTVLDNCKNEAKKSNTFLCNHGEKCSNGSDCPGTYNWKSIILDKTKKPHYKTININTPTDYGFCEIPPETTRVEYEKQFNKLNNIVKA